MKQKYKQAKIDYAEKLVSIRDTVLCMYEERKSYPIDTYRIYRPMLDGYLRELDELNKILVEGDAA